MKGASIAIFRLAPADYHRSHSPLDAKVGATKKIPGTLFTVNPCAINENLDVFTRNKRDGEFFPFQPNFFSFWHCGKTHIRVG